MEDEEEEEEEEEELCCAPCEPSPGWVDCYLRQPPSGPH